MSASECLQNTRKTSRDTDCLFLVKADVYKEDAYNSRMCVSILGTLAVFISAHTSPTFLYFCKEEGHQPQLSRAFQIQNLR